MGLDNGFVVKKKVMEDAPLFVKEAYRYSNDEEVEIVYFRKFWGFRNDFLTIIHADPNKYEFSLDAEDVFAAARILMKYVDQEYYEENANSVWEYDEAIKNIRQSIVNLIWLSVYMTEHEGAEVIFYDSY